jgi:hypothetical protein
MQCHKVLISTLFQRQLQTSDMLSAVSGGLSLGHTVKRWEHNKYWTVLDCTVVKKNFTLLEHYFHMDYEVAKVKGRSNSRFGSIIFFLRSAGISFKMKNMSTLYAIYMITVISCTCITFVGMFVDVYIHRDNLGHVMTNIRVSIGVTDFLWMFLYCR